MPLRPARVGRVGVIGAPVAKTAVVAAAVTPGRGAPVAKTGPPGMIVGRFVVVFAPRLPRQAPPAALPSRTRPGGSRSGLGPEDASLLLGRIFGWP